MIIAETMLTLSWTLLFEIVCRSTHDPLQDHPKSMIIAETVRTWSWVMLFEIVCKSTHGPLQDDRKNYDCSRDGAYIVMDDAVWNRLQTYAVPTPGPSKCMVLGEKVLTLSWTMLFEIVCKRTHDPLLDHQNL